jgi:S-adenosylmethionine hydrolase
MARPVIALLTDFGTRDAYVGAMKGVILDLCAEATLVDLSHDVPPHDVRAGARVLAACVPFYPAGTIFVAVVDPGVGSARRAIAAEAGAFRFVGPDNGVLSAALDLTPPKRLVELTDRRFQRPTVSRTFEGRDRFAPAAAHLARGVGIASLGRAVHEYERLEWPAPHVTADAVDGAVEVVDRFGNLISNLSRTAVETLMATGPVDIHLGDAAVPRLVATYAEAAAGEVCALFGSTDRLEIAVTGGSAAAHFGAGPGSRVAVRRRSDV